MTLHVSSRSLILLASSTLRWASLMYSSPTPLSHVPHLSYKTSVVPVEIDLYCPQLTSLGVIAFIDQRRHTSYGPHSTLDSNSLPNELIINNACLHKHQSTGSVMDQTAWVLTNTTASSLAPGCLLARMIRHA